MISDKNIRLVNQLCSNNLIFFHVSSCVLGFLKDASLGHSKDKVKFTEIKLTEADLQQRGSEEISDVQKDRMQHKYF